MRCLAGLPLYGLMFLLTIYFGIVRLTTPIVSEIHHEDIFKDMAHLFCGGLILLGAGVQVLWYQGRINGRKPLAADCFWIGLGLVVLEIAAFKLHQA